MDMCLNFLLNSEIVGFVFPENVISGEEVTFTMTLNVGSPSKDVMRDGIGLDTYAAFNGETFYGETSILSEGKPGNVDSLRNVP